jgi:hypothetical protein
MESKIMKYLFPEGHKIKNLTRQWDCKQLVLHYIPYIEVVQRLLRNEAFAGKNVSVVKTYFSAKGPHFFAKARFSANSQRCGKSPFHVDTIPPEHVFFGEPHLDVT